MVRGNESGAKNSKLFNDPVKEMGKGCGGSGGAKGG